jgi:hypothetical protein
MVTFQVKRKNTIGSVFRLPANDMGLTIQCRLEFIPNQNKKDDQV